MGEWGNQREREGSQQSEGSRIKQQEGFSFLLSCFIINFHSILIRNPVIYTHTHTHIRHTHTNTDTATTTATFRLRQTHLYAQVSFAACSTTYLCIYIYQISAVRLPVWYSELSRTCTHTLTPHTHTHPHMYARKHTCCCCWDSMGVFVAVILTW